jgi:hypothetical protein
VEREYDPANDIEKWTETEDDNYNKEDGGDTGSREDVLWTIGWEQFVRYIYMYIYLYVHVYLYIYIHIYIHVFIHIYIHT